MLTLSPNIVQYLLRTHLREILDQLGYKDIRLGIPVGDPEPCIKVSVLPQRVSAMPHKVTVSTESGPVDIPLKVSGDYEPFKPL